MFTVFKTNTFDSWLRSLKDRMARARIEARIDRLTLGNFGDVKPVGAGVSELRIDYGPGYRIYFCRRQTAIVVLLCGGNKSSQQADIQEAKKLAQIWIEEENG